MQNINKELIMVSINDARQRSQDNNKKQGNYTDEFIDIIS